MKSSTDRFAYASGINLRHDSESDEPDSRIQPCGRETYRRRPASAKRASVTCLSCSADGRYTVAITKANNIYAATPAAAGFKPIGKSGRNGTVAVSPDGKTFLFSLADSVIGVCDTASGTLQRALSGHTRTVKAFAFVNDGQNVLSIASDDTLRFWDIATGKLFQEIKLAGQAVCLAVSRDNKFAATAAAKPDAVQLWRLPEIFRDSERIDKGRFSRTGPPTTSSSSRGNQFTLSDMSEFAWKKGVVGWTLAKDGKLGEQRNPEKLVVVDGATPAHSLSMCPPPHNYTRVCYSLGKRAATFEGAVAISEDALKSNRNQCGLPCLATANCSGDPIPSRPTAFRRIFRSKSARSAFSNWRVLYRKRKQLRLLRRVARPESKAQGVAFARSGIVWPSEPRTK